MFPNPMSITSADGSNFAIFTRSIARLSSVLKLSSTGTLRASSGKPLKRVLISASERVLAPIRDNLSFVVTYDARCAVRRIYKEVT
ncbi:hypothetical protein ANAPH2_01549 [Anaplasma phagocytophilum]|nr:hypothetical protein ANAPH2_01549 [Anaplasma phagocytophilum]